MNYSELDPPYTRSDPPTVFVELGDSERKLIASLISKAHREAMREPASVRLGMLTQLGRKFAAPVR